MVRARCARTRERPRATAGEGRGGRLGRALGTASAGAHRTGWPLGAGTVERAGAPDKMAGRLDEAKGCDMAGKLTKQEKSWILYDVGNSAFVMLATALIPVYFASIAEPGSSVVVAWGYAETVASLVLALLMPVLGSLADL